MKIGILTFHRACNYGAVLQCYALQEVLKSIGHEVWVIDYIQPFIEDVYSVFRCKPWLRSLLKRRKSALKYPFLWKRRKMTQLYFRNFRQRYLHCTEACSQHSIPKSFDSYVIGSDQLWNSKLTAGLDTVYWGWFERNPQSKLITYAMSTSIQNLLQIPVSYLKDSLVRFSKLSVREDKIASYIHQYVADDLAVETVLDPTLLGSAEIWDPMIDTRFQDKSYILIYEARGYGKRPHLLHEKASILANELHCEIIDLSTGKYTPEEFVSLFKYARYVVTTSFHAVAFSLIFKRPLYAIKLKDGHDDRYENLLNSIHASDMLVDVDFIPTVREYDYEEIENNLEALKKRSFKYLEQ